ncbi:MAG: trypsin-like peptidase domain-containing protein [Betaproteobacteria bacterium]|nr:trypsin-like peptidase domain-containing protein [Betaproteobacteria bacterium]
MKGRTVRVMGVLCVHICSALTVAGLASVAYGQNAKSVFEKVAPSIVVINKIDGSAQGSGVVIARDESSLSTTVTIATNCHLVGEDRTLTIIRGERTAPAEVLRKYQKRDICILTAQADLPVAPMRSVQTLKIGEKVFAVGAPRGLELSISDGIVSQLRNVAGENVPTIQTNAAISPGSSGGGLFDEQGKLLGLTSFYVKSSQNLNFAAPSDWLQEALEAKKVPLHELASDSQVPRPRDLIDRTCGWQLVAQSDALQFYLDPCEVKKYERLVLAWRLQSPQKDRPGTPISNTSEKLRIAYDCDIQRNAVIGIIQYSEPMGKGDILLQTKSRPEPDWKFEDVVPGSINANVLSWACSLAGPNQRKPAGLE